VSAAAAPPRTLSATDVVGTAAEREALARVRELSGERDGPMELHGLRAFLICERLAAEGGHEVDREVLLVAALLHDIGLYEGASKGGAYVSDGRDYAERMLAGRKDWPRGRQLLCLRAIERHHEVRSQWQAGAEVELLRRADLVELSGGLVSFGLERAWIRGLFAAVPRRGVYGEIGRLVARAARERPATLPLIFIRGR